MEDDRIYFLKLHSYYGNKRIAITVGGRCNKIFKDLMTQFFEEGNY
jgi:hypothetical protein